MNPGKTGIIWVDEDYKVCEAVHTLKYENSIVKEETEAGLAHLSKPQGVFK
jgi:hypothetical protein